MLDFNHLDEINRSIIIAHRGAGHRKKIPSATTENSLEAFKAAVEIGAEAIECDLRRTADGAIIIHHNKRLKSSSTLISDMSLARLRRLASKRGFHLPALDEVLIFAHNRIALNLELKETGFEAEVIAAVEKYSNPSQVLFTSFNNRSVRKLKNISAECITGLLVGLSSAGALPVSPGAKALIRRMQECRADYAVIHWRLLTKRFHQRLCKAGIPIIAWTVDRPTIAKKLIDRETGGIISNFPELLLPLLCE